MKRLAGIERIKSWETRAINKMNFGQVYSQIPNIKAIFKGATEHHRMTQDTQNDLVIQLTHIYPVPAVFQALW